MKAHRWDAPSRRQVSEVHRAITRLRKTTGGKCEASSLPRFTDQGTAISAALVVATFSGPVRLQRCEACSGWHFTRIHPKGNR